MPTDVIMPQMGESIFEGTITKWLKKPGDTVQRDEPLFEISTDKVDAEIPSPAAGVLSEIKIAEGNTVQINTVVGVIGDADGQPAAAAAAPTQSPAVETQSKTVDPPSAANSPAPTATAAPASASDVIMPQMGESIFEGTITKWLKKPGDTVQQDEPLFEISTDKVDAEIPSPVAGVLSEIKVQAGNTVQINTVVAVISGAAGAKATPNAPPVPAPSAEEAVAETETGDTESGERVRSSPLVRKIAKENNLDLRQVPGTGSAGRITKEDILGYLAKGAPAA
ncbi:MAG TPA: biotin/lipoyl-containing protein, partial [Acidobacteriaceae bacterium]|nr:biotin/lipoyl-containing protein [Acidobacteriaceae bacterium]